VLLAELRHVVLRLARRPLEVHQPHGRHLLLQPPNHAHQHNVLHQPPLCRDMHDDEYARPDADRVLPRKQQRELSGKPPSGMQSLALV
jgi:hypothetical protein